MPDVENVNPDRGAQRRVPRRWILVGSIVCLVASIVAIGWGWSHSQAPLEVEDLEGARVNVFALSPARVLVLVFVSVECPISNSYAPEYNRLQSEFEPKGVRICLVYANSDEARERIKKHVRDFDLHPVILVDSKQQLARLARVTMTPESAVYVPERGFIYRGRIDNRYADLGVNRPEATEHELRDAIQAALDGRAPAKSSAKAVGCSIAGHV